MLYVWIYFVWAIYIGLSFVVFIITINSYNEYLNKQKIYKNIRMIKSGCFFITDNCICQYDGSEWVNELDMRYQNSIHSHIIDMYITSDLLFINNDIILDVYGSWITQFNYVKLVEKYRRSYVQNHNSIIINCLVH